MKAAIIAGGASRRMGTPKALLDFEGAPLIARVATILREMCDEIVVVTGDARFAAAANANAIEDRFPNRGVLGGIHASVVYFNTAVLCVACDAPFLDARFLQFIAQQSASFDAAVPIHNERAEPLHAIYSPALLPFFEAALQSARPPSVENFLRDASSHGARVRWIVESEAREFDAKLQFFENWNTPEDVAAHRHRTGKFDRTPFS